MKTNDITLNRETLQPRNLKKLERVLNINITCEITTNIIAKK